MASAAILASLCGRSPYAHGWKAAAKIGARTRCIAVCTTRAATGALPRGRVPPVGCGISPRRTGGHREGSVRRGSCTLLRLSPACPPTTIASIDGPSTPGAPWLAWPCCQASQRTSSRHPWASSASHVTALPCWALAERVRCRCRTVWGVWVAIRPAHPPQRRCTPCLQPGPCPRAGFCCPRPAHGTLPPADCSPDRQGLRLPLYRVVAGGPRHRRRSPSQGSSDCHRLPSPTPRGAQTVLRSIDSPPSVSLPAQTRRSAPTGSDDEAAWRSLA